MGYITNQMKEFGAKVKKEMAEYYIYVGKNFTIKFNKEYCETSWWEINILEDNINPVIYHQFDHMYDGYGTTFERKIDLVAFLLQLDKDYENLKNEYKDVKNKNLI